MGDVRGLGTSLWGLIAALGLCVACHPAGSLHATRFVAPERFEALIPDAEEWRLTTNRCTPLGCTVTWTWHPAASTPRDPTELRPPMLRPPMHWQLLRTEGTLFVEVRPLPKRFEALPLDVVAELRFMKRLGTLGGAPRLDSLQRIALDEREAMALVGSRLDRPLRWRHTLVVLRSQGFLMELGYHTLEEDFDQAAPAFERLLRQLKLLLPGDFDPYVLEDIPLFYPGPSGFHAPRRTPKGEAPAGRVPSPGW